MGENHLRAPEPAERPAGDGVRRHGTSVDLHVWDTVRPGRAHKPTPQDRRGEGLIGAGIVHKVDLDRGEGSVFPRPAPVMDDRGVPLARCQDILRSVEDEFHRTVRLPREEGGERRHEGRNVLLPAERPSGCCLYHPYLGQGKTEDPCDSPLHVERTLHRPVDCHCPILLRDGDRPLRLEVGVLLIAGAIHPFDDHVSLRKTLFNVPFANAHGVEQVRAFLDRFGEGDRWSIR